MTYAAKAIIVAGEEEALTMMMMCHTLILTVGNENDSGNDQSARAALTY